MYNIQRYFVNDFAWNDVPPTEAHLRIHISNEMNADVDSDLMNL